METHNHVVLKQKAVEWLYLNAGCKYIAVEIKAGKYIFDVVGTDGKRIFIVEAKQEHADFIADCNDPIDIKNSILESKNRLKETGDVKKYKEELEKERNKSIKFKDKNLLKISSHRYVIAPDYMITKDELPENWGMLNEEPRVIVQCKGNKIEKRFITKIIRLIAKKQTKNFLKENLGVLFEKTIKFPNKQLV